MDNHHWLMSAEALTLLRKLRKRLQAEFDISLRFSEYAFEQHLARAKHKTVDGDTRHMIAQLEKLRGAPFSTGDEPAPRLYRGQPILQENRDIYAMIYGDELSLHDASQPRRQQRKKMYRGQVVLEEAHHRPGQSSREH
ncbi:MULTISPECIES: hypothetical protein [Microbulbifer]|uniref:hypothetical protein n=1 Tax=Microbulbifer TaxID=48073 RepID=UPI001E2DA32D|nr:MULTISPECIES: hypothetical protein [Microbulbifer]UHQ56707.1 hypothetical protein LVE68_06980 [Microbulbifer sp. YPW16]